MSEHRIDINTDEEGYAHGDPIRVTVSWELGESPQQLLVNLLWYTQGKGDEDIEIVTGETIDDPGPSGQRDLLLEAPNHPPSFSGKLISLTWAVEALTEPPTAVDRKPIIIAPDAEEIHLGAVTDAEA